MQTARRRHLEDKRNEESADLFSEFIAKKDPKSDFIDDPVLPRNHHYEAVTEYYMPEVYLHSSIANCTLEF